MILKKMSKTIIIENIIIFMIIMILFRSILFGASFLLGTLINVYVFYRTEKKIYNKEKFEKMKKFFIINNFQNFLIYGIFIFIIVKISIVAIVFFVMGIFSVKIAIVIHALKNLGGAGFE